MKRLALIVGFLATPATAFERMQLSDCQNGWLSFADLMFSFIPEMPTAVEDEYTAARGAQVTLSDDGWCRLTGGTAGMERAAFGTLDWQAEGLDRFIKEKAPPQAFRLRLREIDSETMGFPLHDMEFSLRQGPGSGVVLIEKLLLTDAAGDVLSLTAVVTGADFETPASAISHLGGMALQQVAARLTVTPERMDAPGRGDLVVDLMDGLDEQQLPADSRAALQAVVLEGKAAHGILDLRASAERGLGWMQILWARQSNPDAGNAEMLGFALSGVTIDAEWTPFE